MVARLKTLLRNLINAGKKPGLPDPLVERIRLTNGICLTVSAICFAYAVAYVVVGKFTLAMTSVLPMLGTLTMVYLNQIGSYYPARVGYLTLTNASVFLSACTLGPEAGLQFGYFAFSPLAMLFFEPRDRKCIAYTVLLPMIAFFGLEFLDYRLAFIPRADLDPVTTHLIYHSMIGLVMIVLTAQIGYFWWSNFRQMAVLKHQGSQLRLGMEISQMGNWSFDLRTGKRTISEELKAVVGVTVEPRPGGMMDYVHSEDRHVLESAIKGSIAERRDLNLKHRILRADNGELRWIHTKARTHYDVDGQPLMIAGVSMDITKDIEAQQSIELQRANMVSSAKLSALGEMAAGVAHEINNPLAIIHGRAGQLKEHCLEGPVDAAKIAQMAEKIESTAMRISKIVKALRSFGRDATDDPVETVQIASLMSDTLEMCRERIKNHGIDLKIELPTADLMVSCRPVQISQVLLNLLNNAHDAALQSKEAKWINVSCSVSGSHVVMSITDSGPGIPTELHEKVFQPFFTTKEVGKGTGLGLSISKSIIDSHGGQISIDRDCLNTRMVVVLPLSESQKAAA